MKALESLGLNAWTSIDPLFAQHNNLLTKQTCRAANGLTMSIGPRKRSSEIHHGARRGAGIPVQIHGMLYSRVLRLGKSTVLSQDHKGTLSSPPLQRPSLTPLCTSRSTTNKRHHESPRLQCCDSFADNRQHANRGTKDRGCIMHMDLQWQLSGRALPLVSTQLWYRVRSWLRWKSLLVNKVRSLPILDFTGLYSKKPDPLD